MEVRVLQVLGVEERCGQHGSVSPGVSRESVFLVILFVLTVSQYTSQYRSIDSMHPYRYDVSLRLI